MSKKVTVAMMESWARKLDVKNEDTYEVLSDFDERISKSRDDDIEIFKIFREKEFQEKYGLDITRQKIAALPKEFKEIILSVVYGILKDFCKPNITSEQTKYFLMLEKYIHIESYQKNYDYEKLLNSEDKEENKILYKIIQEIIVLNDKVDLERIQDEVFENINLASKIKKDIRNEVLEYYEMLGAEGLIGQYENIEKNERKDRKEKYKEELDNWIEKNIQMEDLARNQSYELWVNINKYIDLVKRKDALCYFDIGSNDIKGQEGVIITPKSIIFKTGLENYKIHFNNIEKIENIEKTNTIRIILTEEKIEGVKSSNIKTFNSKEEFLDDFIKNKINKKNVYDFLKFSGKKSKEHSISSLSISDGVVAGGGILGATGGFFLGGSIGALIGAGAGARTAGSEEKILMLIEKYPSLIEKYPSSVDKEKILKLYEKEYFVEFSNVNKSEYLYSKISSIYEIWKKYNRY